jgi:hypothetical protein
LDKPCSDDALEELLPILELDRVFAEYLPSSEVVVNGAAARRQLTSGNGADIDAVITQRLPGLLTKFVQEAGRDIANIGFTAQSDK